MNVKRVKRGANSIIIICTLALLLVLLAFLRLDATENVERAFLGEYIRMVELPEIDEKIVLILGGDRSISEIGMWPWPRSTYVELLDERLELARTVAFDILFVDESLGGDDSLLADAFSRHGNVVLCYAEAVDGKAALHSLPELIKVAAGEGFSNGFRDSDGIMRKYRFIDQTEILAPSFICAVAMSSGYNFDWDYNKDGVTLHTIFPDGRTNNINADQNMQFLRFPPPEGKVKTYEMSDVLNGKYPPEEFDGAIVMIGFNASGVSDVVAGANGLVSGTMYNTDSLYTLLSGFNPGRVPAAAESAAVLVMFLLSLAITSRFRINISFLFAILLAVLWIFAVAALFLNNILWISAFIPLVAVAFGYALSVVLALLRSQRDLQVRSLSMDSLLGLSRTLGEASGFETFPDYLDVLSGEIEATTEIEIITPMLDESDLDSEDLARFKTQEQTSGLMLVYNTSPPPLVHRILLALPFMGEDGETRRYTMLGMRKRVPDATIRSVATLIVTAYIYFNASKAAVKRSDMFYSLIQCMISAVDAKDPITSGHSQRVAEFSEQIARWLNLPEEQVEQLKFSGMIHDIGKIGIPDKVLDKPGPYSNADFKTMQTHPLKGAAIMSPVSLSPAILDGVLYHHERVDGKGYPYGLSGDELSLAARIVKIADVYDALCSERQYKKAWPVARALNVFYEGRGTEFDSDIVDVFIEHVKPEGWEPAAFTPGKNLPNAFVLGKYNALISFFREKARSGGLEKLGPLLGRYEGEIDLKCGNSFYSVDWFEDYRIGSFLNMRPQLLSAEADKLVFSLAVDEDPFSFVTYYFLRGFLVAGAVICNGKEQHDLTENFGEALYSDDDITLWDMGRMVIIHAQGTADFSPAVFYIMKAILDE